MVKKIPLGARGGTFSIRGLEKQNFSKGIVSEAFRYCSIRLDDCDGIYITAQNELSLQQRSVSGCNSPDEVPPIAQAPAVYAIDVIAISSQSLFNWAPLVVVTKATLF